ncbi:MAG: multidrug ABC transporter [Legionellales bacterium]|nr:multidrug ABC transporter [Legionellales bacterium]|tara:strand:+ start:7117 stop:9255 length:2139 start_codon:yes stop_codon:yes gene_type:complete
MTDDAYLALLKAESLEKNLLFAENTDTSGTSEMRLLGFCLKYLGSRTHTVIPLSGANIIELLNHNNIHHRQIEAPRDPLASEFPLLIVFDSADGLPYALYRSGNKNWLYNPRNEIHCPLSADLSLLDTAFEVYASLPASISGPLSVIRFAFSGEYPAIFALLCASMVVMLFNLSIPMLTNLLVGKILPQNDQQLLIQGLTIVILIVCGSVATQFLQSLMMLRLESIADLKLQTSVWDRLMRLPITFISRYTTGDLSSRVSSISQLRQLVSNGVFSTLLSTLFAFSYFALMFTYDSALAWWACCFTLVSILVLLWFIWRSICLQMPLIERGAGMTNFSMQAVMALPQIRSAGAEPFLLFRWLNKVNEYALLQLRNNFYKDAMEIYSTLLSPLSTLFLFAVVTIRIFSSQDSIQINQLVVAFISFNAAFASFNGTLTGAVNLIASVAGRAAVLWQRAEPVIYADVETGYQPDAIDHNLIGSYSLRNICYEFSGDSEPLFSNLNIAIEANKHTAITGPSGCGKTTLVRMLLGFVSPLGGELLVDGIPINQLAIRSYRRQLGVVLQIARLNSGSIYEVLCGGIRRTEDEMWTALERAAIADEVRNMPMQLDTMISDSGTTISGGQMQRIAIARALITNPKVLIMDEATSALDNRSQELITATIQGLGMTRISIAHRLSTIQKADKIIIIQRNMTAEAGTWDELKGHGYIKKMLSAT